MIAFKQLSILQKVFQPVWSTEVVPQEIQSTVQKDTGCDAISPGDLMLLQTLDAH